METTEEPSSINLLRYAKS